MGGGGRGRASTGLGVGAAAGVRREPAARTAPAAPLQCAPGRARRPAATPAGGLQGEVPELGLPAAERGHQQHAGGAGGRAAGRAAAAAARRAAGRLLAAHAPGTALGLLHQQHAGGAGGRAAGRAAAAAVLHSDCSTSNTLVELVGALLGAPPLLPHVALLADFLLLMHQVLHSDCSTSNTLVELVGALLGAPPLLPHVALLADFLLLMHQVLHSDCSTSNTLVELVGALLGAPPLLPHVALLADFLLLMHQVLHSDCSTSNTLVELVGALLGAPPLLPHVALLADFLLLMHQVLHSDCSTSNTLVELVGALLGAPPLLPHVALLADFLLLMHQVLHSDCSTSNTLVELVGALLGAPPLLPHVALLADFLLLMHQVLHSDCSTSNTLVELVGALLGAPPLLPHVALLADFLLLMHQVLHSDCSTSNTLVELVGALLGAPPLLPHVALLADFLLLMHQASDTFVTHSRANFYFLLTPETQEMSDFNTNSLKKKPSRRRRQERASVPSAPAEGAPVDSAPSDSAPTEPGEPRDTGQLTDTDAEKTDPDSSVDSTKKMKGIINSQIKENQKTTDTSSVTETSDPPPAVERARAGARDADLTEYIVVDVDDVSHTTVDLYTGGIYHQRRLRAGAEPGWTACEGLLLLLRDAVAVLPDDQLAQALCGAVSVESLIVLANHRSGSVRAALVRVLAALQRRDPPDLARKLRHQHYLLHLANQISLYEGTWELAEACAALLTKCDVPLEDQLDEDIWVEARDEWTWRAAPLLALLPCCLRCVPLAHNVARLLVRLVHV
ncbi:uncharacterized protein LOC114359540, partial [Ostrinia furnacalis]|uniref:uncharacterized protein LOC114359540 n=1 Tax=Ostrinia furnacalis TaxID=93504 RepID=UPI00103EBD5B